MITPSRDDESTVEPRLFHAWYSAEADERFGSSVFHRTDNDSEVAVTFISADREGAAVYLWDDKVYVGLVVLDDRVRKIHSGWWGAMLKHARGHSFTFTW